MTKSRHILPKRVPWTDYDLVLLRELYQDMPTADISGILDRPIRTIYQKAAQLGLKKSEVYLASEAACRLRRGDNVGAEFRFKKGQVPANKGMKGVTYPGCIATQFKPGNRSGRAAQNYQPIGTERISKDGYLERKINDDMPLQRRDRPSGYEPEGGREEWPTS